jgi:hypothetical protein
VARDRGLCSSTSNWGVGAACGTGGGVEAVHGLATVSEVPATEEG